MGRIVGIGALKSPQNMEAENIRQQLAEANKKLETVDSLESQLAEANKKLETVDSLESQLAEANEKIKQLEKVNK